MSDETTVGASQNKQSFEANIGTIQEVFNQFYIESSRKKADGSYVKASLKRSRELSLELRELLKEHKRLSILVSSNK